MAAPPGSTRSPDGAQGPIMSAVPAVDQSQRCLSSVGGSAPKPPGFIAFAPGLSWSAEASCARSAEIPAPESALGSHPCVALSSAQVSPVSNTAPRRSKTVKDVSGTNCKPCPGLDTSPSGSYLSGRPPWPTGRSAAGREARPTIFLVDNTREWGGSSGSFGRRLQANVSAGVPRWRARVRTPRLLSDRYRNRR